MKDVFKFADVPYNLRNSSKFSRSIPCTRMYATETASSVDLKLWDMFYRNKNISNPLRNFKYELRNRLLKTVFARHLDCSLYM